VGWARRVIGLGFLIAADLGLAATPVLAHGELTRPSSRPSAPRPARDVNGPSGLLLAARGQGTQPRSHPRGHHEAPARHAVQRSKPRRPVPPRFHAGPNGVIAATPLTRPGSPGRGLNEGSHRAFIAWYGPVFWPYAYDDLFEYLLWPSDDGDYDDLFWVGAFAATVDPALAPAAAAAPTGRLLSGTRRSVSRSRAGVRGLAGQSREFAQICGGRASGRPPWPAERVSRTLNPTGEQAVVLGAFKTATAAAATVLDNACTNEMPTSPVRRLEAIERRLDAMRQAVAIIRPALDDLYGALDAAQRARLDGAAPDPVATTTDTNPGEDPVSICASPQTPQAPTESELKPVQRAALAALTEALGVAVERLRAACPAPMPWTLPQRLVALETRLGAMLAAVRIERPALAAFADVLSREPKSHADEVEPTPRR
jgi:LTXXQ motif family protein